LMNCWGRLQMNHNDIVITKISDLTDNLLLECFWIANMSRPNNAIMIHGFMQRDVNIHKHILFACFVREQLRGFIKGHIETDGARPESRIDWVFVDPVCGRRGLGTRLINAYESHCRNAGVCRVLVQPAPTRQAKSFYAKHGYAPCGMTYTHAKEL